MHNKRLLVALLLTMPTVACGALPETAIEGVDSQQQAIINGEPCTAAEYPAVGALLIDDNELCTGTLIAPDVVITAAHCVVPVGWGRGQRMPEHSFTLAADSDAPDAHFVRASRVVYHPRFPRWASGVATQPAEGEQSILLNAHDIGVMFLEEAVSAAAFARLPDSGDPRPARGQAVSMVGYGQRGLDASSPAGQKYQADTVVNRVGYGELQIGTALPAPQSCYGDSGGPAFIRGADGRSVILAVTSRDYDLVHGCKIGGAYTRTDIHRDWIQGEIARACRDGVAHAVCGP